MEPVVAVVLAAHTRIGVHLIRNLLASSSIDIIHGLAEIDPRDQLDLTPEDERRLRLHIYPFTELEATLTDCVPEAHLAFIPVSIDSSEMPQLNAYQRHKFNFDYPRRFTHLMFRLGVYNVSILLHDTFGEDLRRVVSRLHQEAPNQAPRVTFFNAPVLLRTRTLPRIPSRLVPVHIRHLAAAMAVHASTEVEKQPKHIPFDPSAQLPKPAVIELNPVDIIGLAKQARRAKTRRRQQRMEISETGYRKKVSNYALQEGAFRKRTPPASTMDSYSSYQYTGSSQSPPDSQIMSPEYATSYREGYAGDTRRNDAYHDKAGQYEEGHAPTATNKSEARRMHNSKTYESLPRTQSQTPSSEPRRFDSYENESNDEYRRYDDRYRRQAPLTSAESLGQQLGRRLTHIRDNDILGDVEPPDNYSEENGPTRLGQLRSSMHSMSDDGEWAFREESGRATESLVGDYYRQDNMNGRVGRRRSSAVNSARTGGGSLYTEVHGVEANGSRMSGLGTQLAAFATRVIRATDRPAPRHSHGKRARSHTRTREVRTAMYEDDLSEQVLNKWREEQMGRIQEEGLGKEKRRPKERLSERKSNIEWERKRESDASMGRWRERNRGKTRDRGRKKNDAEDTQWGNVKSSMVEIREATAVEKINFPT